MKKTHFHFDMIPASIMNHHLYKSIGGRYKSNSQKALLDSAEYIINSIIKTNMAKNEKHKNGDPDYEFKAVEIYGKTYQKHVGLNNKKAVIQMLIDLGFIYQDFSNGNYFTAASVQRFDKKNKAEGIGYFNKIKARSKLYGLTPFVLKNFKMTLNTYRTSGIYKRATARREKTLQLDTLGKRLFNNLSQLRFIGDENFYEMEYNSKGFPIKVKRFYAYWNSFQYLKRLNEYETVDELLDDPYNFYKKKNRVYYPLVTIPSKFREYFLHNSGESLVEIDMNQAQPTIIALLYAREMNLKVEDSKLLRDILNNGDFYKSIAEAAKEMGFNSKYKTYIENRKDFKIKVLSQVYYYNIRNDKGFLVKDSQLRKVFRKLYPDFFTWLEKRKHELGYNEIARTAQKIESEIFVDYIFDNSPKDAFILPIHDALLVKESEGQIYFDLLMQSVKSKFPEFSSHFDKILKMKKL